MLPPASPFLAQLATHHAQDMPQKAPLATFQHVSAVLGGAGSLESLWVNHSARMEVHVTLWMMPNDVPPLASALVRLVAFMQYRLPIRKRCIPTAPCFADVYYVMLLLTVWAQNQHSGRLGNPV